jgi:tetratricopeptide (TPR) repeat protein
MLFDLKGRRRHVVQAVYLLLAILIGGGLVLFGIGGGANGGLLDAFKGGGGSSKGNQILEKQVQTAQQQLAVNPQNQAALALIVKDSYQMASAEADPTTGAFTKDGQKKLQQAASAWDRYLALNPPKPDDTLASYMVQVYGVSGLNQPAKAQKAAEIVSAARPSANAYILVVQYASLAGDTRTAKLAAQKALSLAPKSQRSSVKATIQQAEAAGTSSTSAGTTGTTGSGG